MAALQSRRISIRRFFSIGLSSFAQSAANIAAEVEGVEVHRGASRVIHESHILVRRAGAHLLCGRRVGVSPVDHLGEPAGVHIFVDGPVIRERALHALEIDFLLPPHAVGSVAASALFFQVLLE